MTTTCRTCGRIVRIDFDPADDPGIRGRIEVVFDPHDATTDSGE
ncbi:MAG TPA: hypothetical protein VKE51_28390 [Vicinamibacterales bacterium]|nr:hypothetical protein [Vicinamibacterales bacterium]